MRSLRFSFYLSLGAHLVLLGAVVLGGLAWHDQKLAGDGSSTPQVLTIVGLPEEPLAEAVSPSALAAAPVSVPNPVPEPVSAPVPPPPPVVKELAAAPPVPAPAPPPQPIPPVPSATAAQAAPAAALPSNPPSSASSFSPALAAGPTGQNAIAGDQVVSQPGGSATAREGAGEVRAQPDYRRNPDPPYPVAARRRGQEGLVLLRVIVSAKGRASSVELKQSSGFALLDEAALRAVRDWEFEPARIGPLPLESEIEVPVRFKISP